MAILAIIAVIALGGYAYGFIKTRQLSALRKEMKLYVDRMEAVNSLPTFTAVSTVQL